MKFKRLILLITILSSCDFHNGTYYYNKGCAEDEKGNTTEAIKLYDKALDKNPADLQALNNRAYDYIEIKAFDLARADFEKMLALDNKCPGAYYGLGNLNYELQDYETALYYFDKVIEIKGGGPIFIEHVENSFTKSPYSVDVPIRLVYEYKELSERKLKARQDSLTGLRR